MSYQAVIARVHTRPHPNADRLQLGDVLGNQVVVGLDTPTGTLGVYFPPDGILSEEMCEANDLIARVDPVTKERRGGFFSENRRVRSQKFRGEKSDGYWCPLSSLFWTGIDVTTLKESYAFDALNGHLVCEKYYTPATRRAMANGQTVKVRRGETPFFKKHPDTPQFRFVADGIPEGSICYLSEKIHGTSGRYGLVLDEVPPNWWRRLLIRLNNTLIRNCFPWIVPPAPKQQWAYLHGSRNVILDDDKPGFYGTNDFRHAAMANVHLHKGEVICFEIAGYVQPGTPIMGSHDPKDKALVAQYGKRMEFSYGCDTTHVVFVYRIIRVNDDGFVTELPWPQVVRRCEELGLKPVPSLTDFAFIHTDTESLRAVVELHTEGPSTVDPRHIREGVVLRYETPDGRIGWAKSKSFTFYVLEGVKKDDASFVDAEEAA